MTRPVTILLLTVAALTALVGGTYVVALRHADDPLSEDKIVLAKFRILRDIETLRVQQEIEKRKTAVLKAQFTRQERIEAHGGVTLAAVSLAIFWRLSPMVFVVTALSGAGMFLVFRRVPIETPFVKTALPVRHAAAIVERSLTISNAAEYGRALAFSEEITRGRLADTAKLWASLRGGAGHPGHVAAEKMLPSFHAATVPTFAALWQAGDIGKGKPLLMGFTADGQPQRRTIKDIKAMSVAGQQGAGKTASMAYLITSTLLLSDDAEAFIVDPHWQHEEGLGAMIRPLTQTGRLHLINPMDLEATIDTLDQRLDRRLAGIESSDIPVLFCVDELAKMGKNPLFAEKLLPFVERFTEETRKAGMIGVFGSQKWNARHFCNKADIRATIPSLLIHKIKPSQADLLLEDADNKKLMKAVNLPGQALMATSHDADPSIVTMPLITRADIMQVARRLSESHVAPRLSATGDAQSVEHDYTEAIETNVGAKSEDVMTSQARNAAATGKEQRKTQETAFLSAENLRDFLTEKIARNEETLSGIANRMSVSKGQLYRFLKEKQNPSDNLLTALQSFAGTAGTPAKPAETEKNNEPKQS